MRMKRPLDVVDMAALRSNVITTDQKIVMLAVYYTIP